MCPYLVALRARVDRRLQFSSPPFMWTVARIEIALQIQHPASSIQHPAELRYFHTSNHESDVRKIKAIHPGVADLVQFVLVCRWDTYRGPEIQPQVRPVPKNANFFFKASLLPRKRFVSLFHSSSEDTMGRTPRATRRVSKKRHAHKSHGEGHVHPNQHVCT